MISVDELDRIKYRNAKQLAYYYEHKNTILAKAKEYRKTPEWAAWKKKRQALEKERRAQARQARLAAHAESMSGVCPACGVVFARKRRRKKYCSAKCFSQSARNSTLEPRTSTAWTDALKHASFLSYQRAKKQHTFARRPFVKALRGKADMHNRLARTRKVCMTSTQKCDDLGWHECMEIAEKRARRVAVKSRKNNHDPWQKRLRSIAGVQNGRMKRVQNARYKDSQCG